MGALDLPSGGFHEDVGYGQLGPRKELLGGEWAEAQFRREAESVSDFASYGTEGSVQASSSVTINGHV